SRLIDRPIRPLFPATYRDEVQIQAGPISADRRHDPDVPSMIGASASLRLARIGEEYVALPTLQELRESDLDLIVSSTQNSIVMIEGFAEELPEPEMLAAIMEAHRLNQEVIALQFELLEAAGLARYQPEPEGPSPLLQTIYERYGSALRESKQIRLKADRNSATKELLKKAQEELSPAGGEGEPTPAQVKDAFSRFEERVVRELILE